MTTGYHSGPGIQESKKNRHGPGKKTEILSELYYQIASMAFFEVQKPKNFPVLRPGFKKIILLIFLKFFDFF